MEAKADIGLDKVPVEILLKIAGFLKSEKDLGALVRSSRRSYITLNGVLYERNVFEAHPKHSCVLWAARNDSLNTIKLAYAHGADLNLYDPRSELRITIVWSKRKKVDARKIFSPLHVSVMKGYHHITRYLLDHGASVDIPSVGLCSCHAMNFRPLFPAWYPLHTALVHAKEGEISSEMLIRHGARKVAAECPGLSFQTISHQPSLARLVADLGGLREGNVDALGYAPLHLASLDGMDDVVEMILENPEANIQVRTLEENSTDETGVTPLYAAASRILIYDYPNFKAVEALLAHGADPFLYQKNEHGWTIFHQLLRQAPNFGEVVNPRRAALKRLIELGLEFDTCSCTTQDEYGLDFDSDATPLFFAAAQAQDPECTEILLKAGARPNTPVLNRENPEHMQTQSFLAGVFRHLWWETESRGFAPPLSQAGEIVALLLKYGASLEDVDGVESALEFVCRCPEERMDYSHLDFVLKHATRENVSPEHVEGVINGNRLEFSHTEGAVADHHRIVAHKLIKFGEREFPGEILTEEIADDVMDVDADADSDSDDTCTE